LALEGFDMLIIVAVLAVIFLWGPHKLPEMARSIGQAKREFEKASKEVSSLVDPGSVLTQTSTATSTQPHQDPIVIAAKSLGITTEGKTKQELAKEIVARTAKDSVQQSGNETSVAAA
jgi:sec-independent protein translocase protein TatA